MKTMKLKISAILTGAFLALSAGTVLTSCEDYLDKDPDSTVDAQDAFKDFNNFQGFIEEIYNCVPNKNIHYWSCTWNLGDDEWTVPNANWHMLHQVDLGNFWAWQGGNLGQAGFWFDKGADRLDPRSTDQGSHALYGHAWYCIRKCNLGLENIDRLVGTSEERNFLMGQMYFFRAWWHFEMMQFLGGLPYLDRTIPASESPTEPRLSFQEAAEKCAADFRRAADLLPLNWDNTTVGRKTIGHNEFRINKAMALGYLGKCLLWAGSPLMENGAHTGGALTYSYNEDYCRRAAEAFGELLTLVEQGQTLYSLVEFNYKNVYDHEKADNAATCYSDIFWSSKNQGKVPGSTESMFRGGTVAWGNGGSNSYVRYNYSRTFCPNDMAEGADNIVHHPTANYVENYGMANGMPIDDPDSGYDPTHPFKNRDPRFYHDIVFDGFKYVNGSVADQDKYMQLYTGGKHRNITNASSTGYLYQKLVPHTANVTDQADSYGQNPNADVPYMRLADIYLMYAEAAAAVSGATGKSNNFNRTAAEAVNVIRDRCGAGHVAAKYTASRERFIDEVRRERAVELSFEGLRFNDLQRWLLLTEPKYTLKTAHEFMRVENDDFFKSNDPAEARVSELKSVPLFQREFTAKHYWFPLKQSDTQMYEGFQQNPGW
ncbi:MAG: RagB/SusD family nutrient uptake outer membrane protein [Muribaculaceae bacterium]|nr:RagB/SusD family nutrient uptake outer membrane protein [Muribaculaceae bacterium]